MSSDITDRKRAEEALRETAGYFQNLFDYANVPIITWDTGFRITRFNHAFELLTGRSQDEVLGKTLDILFPDESREASMALIQKTLTGERWETVEIPILTTDGSKKIVLWNSANVLDYHGNITATIAQGVDITERKKRENVHLANEQKYRALVENIPEKIFIKDTTLTYVSCNDHYARDLGITPDAITGKTDFDFYPHDLAEKYRADDQAVMDSGKIKMLEEKYPFDGKEIWISTIKTPIRNDAGIISGILGIFHDISKQKEAEEALNKKNSDLEAAYEEITATEEELRQNYEQLENGQLELRESEERFRVIFERAAVGKSLTAPDGRLLKINQAFANMLGYTIEEMQQLDFARITLPEDLAVSRESIRCLLANERTSYAMEKRYIHKSGKIVWTDVSTTLLRNDQGAPLYFITNIIDITRQKNAEESLKKYLEKLEETVSERTRELREAQDQLVKKEKLAILGKLAGGVGHELRNPLGAIKNAAYFLDMALENPDPDVKEMVELINKEVARSENIISSLLDFARPKTLTLRKESVKKVVTESLKRNPVPGNVTVINNLDETLPEIQTDPDKLLQVFDNLISNAFQAMPTGGKLTITSKLSGPEVVSIAFADTGTGISAENMKKLFEPLFTTKIKGIGLGLVVTKTIVEAHGGHLDVRSEEGKGTTFTVNLPFSGRKAD
jgi:PAS domain S-box-containing protein